MTKIVIKEQDAWDIVWAGLEAKGLYNSSETKTHLITGNIESSDEEGLTITVTKEIKKSEGDKPKEKYSPGDWKKDE